MTAPKPSRGYNARRNDREEHLAGRLTDSELRRVGGLALLNLGYVNAAREVLAGGYPTWPTFRQIRGTAMAAKRWWVVIDSDTFTTVRELLRTPPPPDPIAAAA